MKTRYMYFPANAMQKAWGLYVTCTGRNRVAPNAEYPSRAHPDEYFFTWKKGRILREWQIILVEAGGGTVEFRKRRCTVHPGSLVILPPGCWHRYRPVKDTGWTTLWIGFGGDLASRFASGAKFDPEGDVREFRAQHRFRRLFADTVSDILDNGPARAYSAAARIPPLIAAIAEESPSHRSRAAGAEAVHQAQAYIIEHSCETVAFEALAKSLGLAYRTFRHVFAKETGTSPLQFQLEVRLARAKNLLASSDMPIAEIAETLGFNSTWYFSHFFAKATNVSPREYRSHPSA